MNGWSEKLWEIRIRERISMYVKIVTEWPKQVTKYASGNAFAAYDI